MCALINATLTVPHVTRYVVENASITRTLNVDNHAETPAEMNVGVHVINCVRIHASNVMKTVNGDVVHSALMSMIVKGCAFSRVHDLNVTHLATVFCIVNTNVQD